MKNDKNDIKVESYRHTAIKGAWTDRGNSFWAIGAVGLGLGVAFGAVAPFFPVLAGVQTIAGAAALIPSSLAVFSAVGLGMGSAGGLVVGSSAGATAAVAEEQERREKLRGRQVEEQLHLPPGSLTEDPAKEIPQSTEPKSLWQK